MAEDARWTSRAGDALVAAAFLAAGWLSTGAHTTTDPDYVYTSRDWTSALLLVLATVPYAWRRRWPSAALLLSLLATTTLWLLGYNAGALPLVLLVGVYFVASTRPGSELTACLAVALGCFGLLWWGGGEPYGGREALYTVVTVGASAVLGRAARLRVDLAEARTAAAEEAARRRASEERLRVARDLHDVIGHSLGTIAVQAGVGRHLMGTEPARAAEALDHIARISRGALDEVRAVVASLREGEASYQPTPRLADLPELVQTARLSGLTVELRLPADPEAVPRQVGAAAYRITREALTNVVRHAHATSATVRADLGEDRLELTIRDDGPGGQPSPATGHGIAGMQERAEALGGRVSAGPAAGGGFLVTASLPIGAAR